MKQVEQWQWWIRDLAKDNPKPHRSRWHMTEEEALARDAQARRVEGSKRTIEVAETAEELADRMPTAPPPR